MLKKNTLYILLFIFFVPVFAFGDTITDSLETKLKNISGEARVELLIELSERLAAMARSGINSKASDKKSIRYADEAVKTAYSLKSDSLIVRALIARGNCYENNKVIFLPYYHKAIYYLSRIKKANPENTAKLYRDMYQFYSQIGKADSAEFYSSQLISILEKDRHYWQLSTSFAYSGYTEVEYYKNIRKADSLFDKSFHYLKKLGIDSLLYNYIFDISIGVYNKYKYHDYALKLLEKHYTFFIKLKNQYILQKYYYFLGLVNWDKNDFINAVKNIEKSKAIGELLDEEIGSEYLAYAYELLASIYTGILLWDESEKNFQLGFKYAKMNNNPAIYSKMRMNYATTYLASDSIAKALRIFEEIRYEYKEHWAKPEYQEYYYLSFLSNIATCYFKTKNIDSLRAIVNEISIMDIDLSENWKSFRVNIVNAQYEYIMQNYSKAEEHLRALLNNPEFLVANYDEQESVFHLQHQILFKQGKYSEAYQILLRYKNFQDSVKTSQKIQEIVAMQEAAKYEMDKQRLNLKNEELERKEKQSSVIISLMIIVAAFLIIFTIIVLRERAKSEKLLLNILPEKIAKRLKTKEKYIAEKYNDASIMFIDIAQFTKMSSGIAPERLVEILNDIFTIFDDLSEKHGLEKIKTIGDCYLAVAGIPEPRIDHVTAAADMALDVIKMTDNYLTDEGITINFRIGIDCGPVVAGIIGQKKFIYDLWGDTVNVASRMEDFGEIGEIQVSDRFKRSIESIPTFSTGKYVFVDRGLIEIKGKGKMHAWFLKDNQ